jgi:hypothetical protein
LKERERKLSLFLYAISYPIGDEERERKFFLLVFEKKRIFYWLEKKEPVSLSVRALALTR